LNQITDNNASGARGQHTKVVDTAWLSIRGCDFFHTALWIAWIIDGLVFERPFLYTTFTDSNRPTLRLSFERAENMLGIFLLQFRAIEVLAEEDTFVPWCRLLFVLSLGTAVLARTSSFKLYMTRQSSQP
jgi:hypothetical protein